MSTQFSLLTLPCSLNSYSSDSLGLPIKHQITLVYLVTDVSLYYFCSNWKFLFLHVPAQASLRALSHSLHRIGYIFFCTFITLGLSLGNIVFLLGLELLEDKNHVLAKSESPSTKHNIQLTLNSCWLNEQANYIWEQGKDTDLSLYSIGQQWCPIHVPWSLGWQWNFFRGVTQKQTAIFACSACTHNSLFFLGSPFPHIEVMRFMLL